MQDFADMYRKSFNMVNSSGKKSNLNHIQKDPVKLVITRKRRNKVARTARRINRR